jgi:hypothetical protein
MYTYVCIDLPSTLTSPSHPLPLPRGYDSGLVMWFSYVYYVRVVKISKDIFRKTSRSPGRWNLIRTLTPHRRRIRDYYVGTSENILRNMAHCHPLKFQLRGCGTRNRPSVCSTTAWNSKREDRTFVKSCNLKAYVGLLGYGQRMSVRKLTLIPYCSK